MYQPELKQPFLRVFRRAIFPQTVIALTDQQVILLQQDLRLKTHNEWLFTFIPLHCIESIVHNLDKGKNKVIIQFDKSFDQQPIELIFGDEALEKW